MEDLIIYANDLIVSKVALNALPHLNTAVLQAELDTGKNVYIPEGAYNIAPGLSYRAGGQRIFGAGEKSVLVLYGSDGAFFNLNGFHSCGISNLSFMGKDATGITMENGAVLRLNSNETQQNEANQTVRFKASDLMFDSVASGIVVTDHNNVLIENVVMAEMRGIGILAEALNINSRIDILSIKRFVYSAADVGHTDGGMCYALYANGNVQTIDLEEFLAVRATRGIWVRNTEGAQTGQRPAFLFGHNVQIDFPLEAGIQIEAMDRARFTDLYIHGSMTSAGFVTLPAARDVKLSNGSITGNYQSGMSINSDIVDIVAIELEWNSQESKGKHSHVELGRYARRISLIGGGTDDSAKHGVSRETRDTKVAISGWRGSKGWWF